MNDHCDNECECNVDVDYEGVTRRDTIKTIGAGLGASLLPLSAAANPPSKEDERYREEVLFGAGSTKTYRGKYLDAILFPVGALGGGCVMMNGQGERAAWMIFNNFVPAFIPDSFLALRVAEQGKSPTVRLLQTTPCTEGTFLGPDAQGRLFDPDPEVLDDAYHKNLRESHSDQDSPFVPVKSINFRGEYPLAWYEFHDKSWDKRLKVGLEVYNPVIPFNLGDSEIPAMFQQLSLENTGTKPLEISFLMTQQNAVGYCFDGAVRDRKYPGYHEHYIKKTSHRGRFKPEVKGGFGGNVNRFSRDNHFSRRDDWAMLHMTSEKWRDTHIGGDMVLACLSEGVTGNPSWTSYRELHDEFTRTGKLSGKVGQTSASKDGVTHNGALAVTVVIPPGKKKTIPFMLGWHFGGQANAYSKQFKNAVAVAEYYRDHHRRLREETGRFHDTFYQSNLPHWLKDRIVSQLGVLKSRTIERLRGGKFRTAEGCLKFGPDGGCCGPNSPHVWCYVQAHARLFPEMARSMDGVGKKKWDAAKAKQTYRPSRMSSVDALTGKVLRAARAYMTDQDDQWLRDSWPGIRSLTEYITAAFDKDEKGTLSGLQFTTLDSGISGLSSWTGGLYLAALRTSEYLAGIVGDQDAAGKFRAIREKGVRTLDKKLFNGEYYIHLPEDVGVRYDDGCEIDQVLGEWWLGQLGLPINLPVDHVRKALQALVKYNFISRYPDGIQKERVFVAPGDSGMRICAWPRGIKFDESKRLRYSEEVMSGFEYSAAATMMQLGMVKEALTTLKGAYDRYDGRLRFVNNVLIWNVTGNPFGDDECGKFYSRAMSIWSVLLASQGFVYDGPQGRIGFRPQWKPDDHKTFFTGAEGYGLFSQRRTAKQQKNVVAVSSGKLTVKELLFELEADKKVRDVGIRLDGKKIDATQKFDGRDVVLRFDDSKALAAGQAIEVTLTLV